MENFGIANSIDAFELKKRAKIDAKGLRGTGLGTRDSGTGLGKEHRTWRVQNSSFQSLIPVP
jgi:hypothetical protein